MPNYMPSIYHNIRRVFGRMAAGNGDRHISLQPRSSARGRVLLSYLRAPFAEKDAAPPFTSHTNQLECFEIAQTFLDLRFQVDVVEWTDQALPRTSTYSVVVDIHSNLERYAQLLPSSCIKVLHITGAHWLYQNSAEYGRCLDLQKRRGVTVTPRRQVPPSRGIEAADYATLLGNEFTEETFRYAGKRIFRVPLLSTVTFPPPRVTALDRIRNRFLWLGGSGAVHKGLDLVLEAVAASPELELVVCGPVRDESDFATAYAAELDHSRNIRTVGWVDVGTSQFAELLQDVVGIIYPSASEGQAGSVITGLHGGLIPIVSRQSGVTVDDFGFTLENCTVGEIKHAMHYVSSLPTEELAQRSHAAWRYARENHTRELFRREYARAIKAMLVERSLLDE